MTAQELVVWEELSTHILKDFWPRQFPTGGIGLARQRAVETQRGSLWSLQSGSKIRRGLKVRFQESANGAWAFPEGQSMWVQWQGEAGGNRWGVLELPWRGSCTSRTGLGLSGCGLLTHVSWLIPLHLIYFLAGQLLSHWFSLLGLSIC